MVAPSGVARVSTMKLFGLPSTQSGPSGCSGMKIVSLPPLLTRSGRLREVSTDCGYSCCNVPRSRSAVDSYRDRGSKSRRLPLPQDGVTRLVPWHGTLMLGRWGMRSHEQSTPSGRRITSRIVVRGLEIRFCSAPAPVRQVTSPVLERLADLGGLPRSITVDHGPAAHCG